MPMPRHGVAGAVLGNEFHLVSGMMQTAGAMTFMDPQITTYTAVHDVLELKANPLAAASTGSTSNPAAPSAEAVP
jgi:hypothetical protein